MENKTSTGLDLNAARLATPPLHIPDNNGGSYKTELVLQRVPFVEKINWWHGPDPRKEPHSHPWPFRSTILAGGYTETRWTKQEDGTWKVTEYEYNVGDINDIEANVYHNVTSVKPGTVTHMVCGPLVENGAWGHLDLETMTEVPAKLDPEFRAKMVQINPHLAKK
jgi:hypothetical protein